jgi:hypothetical protein
MRFARATLLFIVFVSSALAAETKLALQPGESLNYRVAWGIFPHAGEITVGARSEIDDGKPHTVVTTTTSTRGVLRRLFQFEAKAESVFDTSTGRLNVLTEVSAGGKKKTNTAIEFDYAASQARYTDFLNSENNHTVPIGQAQPMDLIMSLIQTRSWDMKPGDKRDIDVIFGKEIYELTVHAIEYEQVETRMGSFKTLELEPRMEKTPPKGMFKRGSRVHVWIAQDDPRHLPVKFEVEFSFGAGVATLAKYQPPGSTGNGAAKNDDSDTADNSRSAE